MSTLNHKKPSAIRCLRDAQHILQNTMPLIANEGEPGLAAFKLTSKALDRIADAINELTVLENDLDAGRCDAMGSPPKPDPFAKTAIKWGRIPYSKP